MLLVRTCSEMASARFRVSEKEAIWHVAINLQSAAYASGIHPIIHIIIASIGSESSYVASQTPEKCKPTAQHWSKSPTTDSITAHAETLFKT